MSEKTNKRKEMIRIGAETKNNIRGTSKKKISGSQPPSFPSFFGGMMIMKAMNLFQNRQHQNSQNGEFQEHSGEAGNFRKGNSEILNGENGKSWNSLDFALIQFGN